MKLQALALLGALAFPLLGSSCIVHVGNGSSGYKTNYTSKTKSARAIANGNRKQMREKLEVGMTEQQAREVMVEETWNAGSSEISNPHRTESFPARGGKRADVLFYYTETYKSDGFVTEEELSPVYFVDGLLVGWGTSGFDAWKQGVLADE